MEIKINSRTWAKSTTDINNEDVIIYTNEYLLKNKLSASYQNQVVNAIKLYFTTIQDKKIELEKYTDLSDQEFYPMY